MNVGFAIPRQFMATFIEDAESPLKSRSTWLLYANAALMIFCSIITFKDFEEHEGYVLKKSIAVLSKKWHL